MQIDEELWANHQYEVLVRFVHHLAYYRILFSAYNELHTESEFWKYTIDAHILRSIIDWCMVFGTDSNEVHWKKAALNDFTQSDFRSYLLKSIGLSLEQWSDFRSNMMDFRNKYATHNVFPYPSMPIMDTALRVAVTYDNWFRERVNAAFDDPSLQERYDGLMRTLVKPLKRLVRTCGQDLNFKLT